MDKPGQSSSTGGHIPPTLDSHRRTIPAPVPPAAPLMDVPNESTPTARFAMQSLSSLSFRSSLSLANLLPQVQIQPSVSAAGPLRPSPSSQGSDGEISALKGKMLTSDAVPASPSSHSHQITSPTPTSLTSKPAFATSVPVSMPVNLAELPNLVHRPTPPKPTSTITTTITNIAAPTSFSSGGQSISTSATGTTNGNSNSASVPSPTAVNAYSHRLHVALTGSEKQLAALQRQNQKRSNPQTKSQSKQVQQQQTSSQPQPSLQDSTGEAEAEITRLRAALRDSEVKISRLETTVLPSLYQRLSDAESSRAALQQSLAAAAAVTTTAATTTLSSSSNAEPEPSSSSALETKLASLEAETSTIIAGLKTRLSDVESSRDAVQRNLSAIKVGYKRDREGHLALQKRVKEGLEELERLVMVVQGGENGESGGGDDGAGKGKGKATTAQVVQGCSDAAISSIIKVVSEAFGTLRQENEEFKEAAEVAIIHDTEIQREWDELVLRAQKAEQERDLSRSFTLTLQDRNTELLRDYSAVTERAQLLKTSGEEAKGELATAKGVIEGLKAEYERVRGEVGVVKEAVEVMKEEVQRAATADSARAQLERDFQTMLDDIHRRESQEKSYREEVQKEKESMTMSERQNIEEMEKKLEQLKEQYNSVVGECTAARTACAAATERAEKAERVKDEFAAKIALEKAEWETQRCVFEQRMDEWVTREQDFAEAKSHWEKERLASEETRSGLEAEKLSLEGVKSWLERDVKGRMTALASAQADLAKAKAMSTDDQTKWDQERKALRKDLDDSHNARQRLSEEYKMKAGDLEAEKSALQTELLRLKEALEKSTREPSSSARQPNVQRSISGPTSSITPSLDTPRAPDPATLSGMLFSEISSWSKMASLLRECLSLLSKLDSAARGTASPLRFTPSSYTSPCRSSSTLIIEQELTDTHTKMVELCSAQEAFLFGMTGRLAPIFQSSLEMGMFSGKSIWDSSTSAAAANMSAPGEKRVVPPVVKTIDTLASADRVISLVSDVLAPLNTSTTSISPTTAADDNNRGSTSRSVVKKTSKKKMEVVVLIDNRPSTSSKACPSNRPKGVRNDSHKDKSVVGSTLNAAANKGHRRDPHRSVRFDEAPSVGATSETFGYGSLQQALPRGPTPIPAPIRIGPPVGANKRKRGRIDEEMGSEGKASYAASPGSESDDIDSGTKHARRRLRTAVGFGWLS